MIVLLTINNCICSFRKFKMGDLPSEIEGLQSFCHQLYIDKAS